MEYNKSARVIYHLALNLLASNIKWHLHYMYNLCATYCHAYGPIYVIIINNLMEYDTFLMIVFHSFFLVICYKIQCNMIIIKFTGYTVEPRYFKVPTEMGKSSK